jgi:tRNA-modifying protein YgfZ
MINTVSRSGYDAARQQAALVRRDDRAWIVVSGQDRRAYLNGLFTNDIASLVAGGGCYSAYLTPQGRMIADLWVYELGDVVLLSLSRQVKDAVLAKLDQFIFSEDVQLGEVTLSFMPVAIVGPDAATILSATLGIEVDQLTALPAHGNCRQNVHGEPAVILRTSDLGEPGFDILVDVAQIERLRSQLVARGAVEIDAPTATAVRVEAGVPKFLVDMDEQTIPLEAGIEGQAISMTKGCYVGQEVIVRVLHRGHGRVARKLVGLSLDRAEGAAYAAGQPIEVDGKSVGELTSVTWSPILERPLALGYVARDYVAPGTSLTVDGRPADVVALPVERPTED